jgi:hypothetical protein
MRKKAGKATDLALYKAYVLGLSRISYHKPVDPKLELANIW